MVSTTKTKEGDILFFQDVLQDQQNDAEEDSTTDVANVFFELANAPEIRYRIPPSSYISIRQDPKACGEHTGGIVWETSFLLLNYLRTLHDGDARSKKYPCGKVVVELGAGCGLLGLGIYHSKLARQVILTETPPVLDNLRDNVYANRQLPGTKESSKHDKRLRVGSLDWTRYQDDCHASNIEPHSVDMIVGTDVVFTPSLVLPLLETIQYLAHKDSTILLCLQERCKDSHQLLLSKAVDFNLAVEDISKQVVQVPSCEWGEELECCVLSMRVVQNATSTKEGASSKKKRKRS
eukprot:Nitzschia sp. Nitz4//scaffold83_size84149//68078//68956//NITZ4_005185-RA/size84149-processed-gene-0.67-mRNA-1//-1//CDS//3329558980//4771//frame0